MAKDIAALSGGDETAFKAALASMGYPVPLASATLSAPVEYIDLALPTGYSGLLLDFINISWRHRKAGARYHHAVAANLARGPALQFGHVGADDRHRPYEQKCGCWFRPKYTRKLQRLGSQVVIC